MAISHSTFERIVKARVRTRPIRIAFLIPNTANHDVLDAVMDFAHSIWTGRFSPIVVVENGLIAPAYWYWLKAFDADLICNYAQLSDAERLRLLFELDPAQIVDLDPAKGNRVSDISEAFEVTPLSSLLTLPLKRPQGIGPASVPVVFDVGDDSEVSRSLIDTFGSFSHSFPYQTFPDELAEFAKTVTLTREETYKDPRRLPKPSGDVAFSASEAWAAMLLRKASSLSTMSAYRSPRAELEVSDISHYFQLVIGDTLEDRVLHWNIAQFFPKWRDGELTSLRITKSELDDPAILEVVREYVQRRNRISQPNNSASYIAVRSSSLDLATLETLSDRLKHSRPWALFRTHSHDRARDILPSREKLERLQFDYPSLGRMLTGWEEFPWNGHSLAPLELTPPHLSEMPNRSFFQLGNWAVDFALDRRVDHSQYSNVNHTWRFSRRYRMANAVRISSRDRGQFRDGLAALRRVERFGSLTTFASLQRSIQLVTMPSDEEAFQQAFVLEGTRYPASYVPQVPRAPARRFERSDKGDYLKGVTGLFGDLHTATNFLTHQFWNSQLELWGANANATDESANQLYEKLKRRLNGRALSGESDLKNVAQEAAGLARTFKNPWNTIRHSRLARSWEDYREKFWTRYRKTNPHETAQTADVEDYARAETASFIEAVHELVAKGVLFQGITSTCRNCRHSNWFAVGNLATVLDCQICQAPMPVPLEMDWEFKLNPFLLECLREHGIQAVFWALSICRDRSRSSFFYQEPSDIWFDNPEGDRDTDVDLAAVLDGSAYAIEVKSSVRNFGATARQEFVDLARRLRPDVAVAAIMAACNETKRRQIVENLRSLLADDTIEIEVWTLETNPLSDRPFL